MMLWLLLALLTFALVAALLLPLRGQGQPAAPASEYDLSVYRDQLAELERDVARGTLAPGEADAARAEISRRMLAAAERRGRDGGAPGLGPRAGFWVKIATAAVIPMGAIGFYIAEGHPGVAGVPHAERLAKAEQAGDFDALIFKVKAHLEKNPQDLRGWEVLVRSLYGRGLYAEAAEAMAGQIQHAPLTADLLADYGEMQVLANGGAMTEKAALAFAEAVKMAPGHPKSIFFQGLALNQQGKAEAAIAMWQKLLDEAPADAPWREAVATSIAQARNPAPAAATGMPELSSEQLEAAKSMSPEERQQMIRAMVDGLAEKLAANGKDLDGWLRLARARAMLGEAEAAGKALDSAEANFGDDTQAMAKIAAARQTLGVKP